MCGHLLAEIGGVGAQGFAEVVGRGEQIEDGERGGDDRRGERVRKEIRAGALAEELDDFFAAGGVASAGAAEGFAEGPGDDVDAALDAAVLGGSAAVGADEADGVGVVDHHHGVVFFGEVADLVELGEVAIHGEDAVGGDEAMRELAAALSWVSRSSISPLR